MTLSAVKQKYRGLEGVMCEHWLRRGVAAESWSPGVAFTLTAGGGGPVSRKSLRLEEGAAKGIK